MEVALEAVAFADRTDSPVLSGLTRLDLAEVLRRWDSPAADRAVAEARELFAAKGSRAATALAQRRDAGAVAKGVPG
jgi:hypothetical protein